MKNLFLRLFFCLTFCSLASLSGLGATYNLNPQASKVEFSIKHLKFAEVQGSFGEFSGNVHLDPSNLKSFSSEGKILVKSLNTGIKGRDEHLKSAEIFNIFKYPNISFKADSIEENAGIYKVKGLLTIKDKTKQITLTMKNLSVKEKQLSFDAYTSIRRKDFGIDWSQNVEGFGLVGDYAKVHLKVLADK